MAEKNQQCEFFLLRYVPDLIKNEFVNFGIVLRARGDRSHRFAGVRFTRDWQRLRRFDSAVDLEMLSHLESDVRKRLESATEGDSLVKQMQDSFSGTVQLSSTQVCQTDSPQEEIEKLAQMYLETPPREALSGQKLSPTGGRQAIFQQMKAAFEDARVWELMRKRIAVAPYTHPGDPLKIDCGYRPNGVVKLFHAVSLRNEIDSAKALAFSCPQLREGIARAEKAEARLTAVIEDGLDHNSGPVAFALETLQSTLITVATVPQMPALAELAAKELRV